MNPFSLRFLCGCFIAAVCVKTASAQNPSPDSLQQAALNHITSGFYKSIGQQALLYNGPEYPFHLNTIKGNAYFNDMRDWQAGTITYDGFTYQNIKMLYDINRDVVAVLMPDNYSMFSPLNKRLESFSIGERNFVNMPGSPSLKAGIYNLLYNGKVAVLGKSFKSIQASASTSGRPEQFFKLSQSYFLGRNTVYHSIGSQSAMLNVLKDKKKELQQYIKTNKLKFGKNPEQVMVLIAAEYDRLTH